MIMTAVCPHDSMEVKKVFIPILCCIPSVRKDDRNNNRLSRMQASRSVRRSEEV